MESSADRFQQGDFASLHDKPVDTPLCRTKRLIPADRCGEADVATGLASDGACASQQLVYSSKPTFLAMNVPLLSKPRAAVLGPVSEPASTLNRCLTRPRNGKACRPYSSTFSPAVTG